MVKMGFVKHNDGHFQTNLQIQTESCDVMMKKYLQCHHHTFCTFVSFCVDAQNRWWLLSARQQQQPPPPPPPPPEWKCLWLASEHCDSSVSDLLLLNAQISQLLWAERAASMTSEMVDVLQKHTWGRVSLPAEKITILSDFWSKSVVWFFFFPVDMKQASACLLL